ncbi:flagellin [Methylobacterium terrae]|uniref:Flagellin n=1 Tax=Methylobacterium terrae TaxID=2202827 RepID=A0A2U8WI88_9HYPH|nr:flagellin [Methylobacterium terrae]AWN45231.1 flagellin [Methylobacterium terrae]
MASLLTNVAALAALTTLKGVNTRLDAVSHRVSTGRRVSSAADNAAYWAIATAVRTDNSSLSALKDTLGLGASAVDVAYNGLSAVLGDLQSLRAKLQTALAPGIDRAKIQVEIAALQERMKATASASNASGQNWLSVDSTDPLGYRPVRDYASGFSRNAAGGIEMTYASIPVADIALYNAGATRTTAPATPARVTADSALTGGVDFGGPQDVRFTVSLDGSPGRDLVLNGTTLAAIAANLAGVTAQELVRALNVQIAADPALASGLRAGLDGQGLLYFETTATGAARSLVIDRTSSGTTVAGVNLLANSGFESGLTDWSLTGDLSYSGVRTDRAHTGSNSIAFGTVNGTSRLAQAIATVPGQSYQLEFWLQTPGGVPSNFLATWDGTPVLALADTPSQPFTRYAFTVTASGSSTTLAFEARHVPSYWFLDDVAVTATPTGPPLGFGSAGITRASGHGSAATTANGGILDAVDARTGTAIASLTITGLGDPAIAALVDQVDGAIARVTDAGTRLGASKTLIAGQTTFLDTLIKTNARTIGILVDADIELETTRVKALQTQQQLALQALSIANASNSTVLSLFR